MPDGDPQREAAGRWGSTPALRVTAALHVGGALALAGPTPGWRWVAGTLLANHGVLFAASLAPRSRLLGPNLVRLPPAAVRRREVALTFDDGPDREVTPRVLDLLEARAATASFFCIGERVAAAPLLAREIVRRGHSIENHSHRHSVLFGCYGPWRLRREIETAQAVLSEAVGSPPRFFRAPHGTRSPWLAPALGERLTYVSWTRRGYDAVDRDPARVLRRLTRGLSAGDVLLLHDGGRASAPREQPMVLRVLPELLDQLAARGLKSVSLRAACRDECE